MIGVSCEIPQLAAQLKDEPTRPQLPSCRHELRGACSVSRWGISMDNSRYSFVRCIGQRIVAGLLPCLLLVMLLAPSRAHGQFGMMGGGAGGFEAPITNRSVAAYSKILSLDSEQQEIVGTLLEGYREAFKTSTKQMQEDMTKQQEKMQGGDMSGMKEMQQAGKRAQDRMEALEKGFFSDLKALLTEEQSGSWERVERYRRRETGMRFGFMSGAAVDLVAIAERTKIEPANKAEYDTAMADYERAIDQNLVSLEKTARQMQEDALKEDNMQAMFDMGKIEAMMKKLADSGKAMKETNRQYARRISSTLGDDGREKFDIEVKRRSFPRVYKESHVMKMITAAEGFTDLDPAQKDALGSVRSQYVRELSDVNDRWAAAVEAQEEKLGGTIMVMMKQQMSMFGAGGDEKEKDPIAEAKKARKEIDEKAEERIKGVLKPEQVSKLPERTPEPANDFEMMFGGEDADPEDMIELK